MPKGKVCIVGAGIAGVCAGHTLKKQGIEDIIILEAAPVIGGRMKNVNDHDSFQQDFPIALGAEWIHTDPKILNEITGDSNTSDKIQTAYHHINPFRLWTFRSFFLPIWPSTGENYKWVNFSWFDFLNTYLVPTVQENIILNQQVTRINYEDDSTVKVYTQQGDVYECARVIVTVSLQMLKDETIKFEPPLSKEKQMALEGATMASGFKLFMEFKEKFYLGAFDHANRIFFDGEGGYFDATYGQTTTDKNLLGLICVGDDYTLPYFEHKGSPDLITFVMAQLDQMFHGKASPNLIKWKYEEWTPESKPFVRGAYSWRYENTQEDIRVLSDPIQDRVYFAGEALPVDEKEIGYAHNAALSGKRAAKLISTSMSL